MRPTTVQLPDDLTDRAERSAAALGISLDDLIRDSLEAHLRGSERPRSADPLFADVPVYDGPHPSDLAERHDHYLYGSGE
jgi:plasmid stability protein